MKDINSAFLQKLGWNILNHPDHLWVQILKAKYFPRNSFLQSHSKPAASLVWQGISKVLDQLKLYICYCPRNGGSLNIRQDPWLPLQPGFQPEWLPNASDI